MTPVINTIRNKDEIKSGRVERRVGDSSVSASSRHRSDNPGGHQWEEAGAAQNLVSRANNNHPGVRVPLQDVPSPKWRPRPRGSPWAHPLEEFLPLWRPAERPRLPC